MPDGDELKDLAASIETLKTSFDEKVAEMKTGIASVASLETGIEELKTKITAGEATMKELVDAKEEVKTQRTDLDATRKALDEVVEQMSAATTRLAEIEAGMKRLPQGPGEVPKTIGEEFVASDAYKAFAEGGGGLMRSDAVSLKSFWRRGEQKAGEITGASLGNLASYLYLPVRVPGIIGPPEIPPRVRDLFPVNRTTVGAIEFVRETGFTNEAAPVAEVGDKPQSALTFESVSLSVRTIAHWLPVTRQIIMDAAQLQAYIDTRLLYGLALTEDDELLNGDGTGAHLTGLLTDTDIQTYSQVAGQTMADAVRRAMTLGEVAGYPATGTVLHPNDWEDIELLKDSQGQYIWAKVQELGQRRLWGQPVVCSVAIDESSFATGAFALAAAIWDREESAVRISDQHSDFFTKNLLAVLAEERLCFTVYRPEAMVLGTFLGAGS